MIKAIIFDCFGVLSTEGWIPYRYQYFGNNKELFEHSGDLQKQVDAGLMSIEDFIKDISEMSGVDEQSTTNMLERVAPNRQLIDFIRSEIAPKYSVGMLSNAGDNWLDKIFAAKDLALFDEIALSFQNGYIKPDANSYESIASRLGVETQECIFVDDQERYCTGAIDVGMKAVWYKDFDQMRTDLYKILAANTKN